MKVMTIKVENDHLHNNVRVKMCCYNYTTDTLKTNDVRYSNKRQGGHHHYTRIQFNNRNEDVDLLATMRSSQPKQPFAIQLQFHYVTLGRRKTTPR